MIRNLARFLLLFLCAAGVVRATGPTKIEITGSPMNSSNNTSTWKMKLLNPTATNDTIIVACMYANATNPTMSVTDDQSNSWTTDKAINDAGNIAQMGIAHASAVAANTKVVTISWSHSVNFYKCTGMVVNNVTGLDATCGSIAQSGTTWNCSSMTTTQANDFIVTSCNPDNFSSPSVPFIFAAGSGFTLADPDGTSVMVSQYGTQGSAGAINPSVTSSVSAASAECLGAAYKTGSTGGAPGNGIYVNTAASVNFPESVSLSGKTFTVNTPCPASSNLMDIAWQASGYDVTSISSSPANTWNLIPATANGAHVSHAYAANATLSPTMTVTVTTSSAPFASAPFDMKYYCISGAATSPFDKSASGTGTAAFSSGDVAHAPDITPADANELVIGIINEDVQTVTAVRPGNIDVPDVGVYSGAQLEQDGGWMHYYAPTNSTVNITWTYSAYTTTNIARWASQAIAFKAASSGGGANPTITGSNPTSGVPGTPVTLTGTNFGTTQGTSSVNFNGATATPTIWNASSITAQVPSGATTGNIVVTVGGMPSNGMMFTVTSSAPSITSLNPTSGTVGSSITITGVNFGSAQGASTVRFNGTSATPTSWTSTTITVPVPVGATTGNIVVTVGGVASNGMPFTVTSSAPSITSLNPTSGTVGSLLTITGTNFGLTQGTSTVQFNGTSATPTSWTPSSITVPVPAMGTGNAAVVVTIGGVASNSATFTITLTSASPTLVQHAGKDAGVSASSSLAFPTSNTAGNWIAVLTRAGQPGEVFTVGDSNGNTYRRAVQFNETGNGNTLGVFYAENIVGGPNTVTVSDTAANTLRFIILEYSGVATANSLDVTATAQGNSTTMNSGTVATTSNGDLLLGAILTANAASFTAGTNYRIEQSVPAQPSAKLIGEDQVQPAAGPISASASLAATDFWAAAVVAFRSASGSAPPPISISVSPTLATVPAGGAQAVTATLQFDSQNKGANWSLSGTGCSGSSCGTLSNVTTTSATYNGPAISPQTVTLKATSIADSTKSASASITVTSGSLTVTVSPKRSAITTSQTQQFAATVTGDSQNAGVIWSVDGNNGGNASTGTISSTGLFTPGSQPGQHTVSATSISNASFSAAVTIAVTDLAGVFTHHNDVARTGQNLKEYALAPATVNSATFGLLFTCPVDGYVYAEPLYVSNLAIGGIAHNVVFIATEHDSIYAFDADSPSCTQLWKVSFLGTNVTTVPSADTGTSDLTPEIGITSTPVIDPSTNTIYVVPKTKETVGAGCSTGSPCYFHRLHALDLTTGLEKFGGPVVITAPNFVPLRHLQRPALLLANNTVYVSFGSHGDVANYQGWLIGYDPATLAQKFAWSTTDATSGNNEGAIWSSGCGPAVDANGNIYIETGNGDFNANTGGKNYSDSAVKLSPAGSVLDYFTPFNQSTFSANDVDLGSGGVVILPDSVGSLAHPHLALVTGKVGTVYLIDQTNMGKFNSGTNSDVQEVTPVPPPNTTNGGGGVFGSPAYWNGNVYVTGVGFPLSQYLISNGALATPANFTSSNRFPSRGATPAISANGTSGGLVWILDLTGWNTNGPAILDAYDATNVSTLLYSSPASGSGSAGNAVKFTVPTVANGKVYLGGQKTFTVFGLKPN
jgi:hypothetical protein